MITMEVQNNKFDIKDINNNNSNNNKINNYYNKDNNNSILYNNLINRNLNIKDK